MVSGRNRVGGGGFSEPLKLCARLVRMLTEDECMDRPSTGDAGSKSISPEVVAASQANATLRDLDEAPAGTDVTERKLDGQVKARLAAIVDSSDDAIISKDLNGVILTWNGGAARLFGYTADEAIGRSVTMLMPPERVDEEPGILERIRRGEPVDHYETVRQHKDGSLIDISLSVSPLRDEHGTVVGASKIARDITRRRRAEQALLQADRQKNEFLATLAHELRNPLAPIRNSLNILRLTRGD